MVKHSISQTTTTIVYNGCNRYHSAGKTGNSFCTVRSAHSSFSDPNPSMAGMGKYVNRIDNIGKPEVKHLIQEMMINHDILYQWRYPPTVH